MLVGRVVIGMDPHKRSATIEVLDDDAQRLMAGRFGTTARAIGYCWRRGGSSRSGCGRSRAARGWAGILRSGWSPTGRSWFSRRQFATRYEARAAVAGWIDGFYNRIRRHSSAEMGSPIDHELAAAATAAAA